MGRIKPWQGEGVRFSGVFYGPVRDSELAVEYVLRLLVLTTTRPEGSSILFKRTSKNPAR